MAVTGTDLGEFPGNTQEGGTFRILGGKNSLFPRNKKGEYLGNSRVFFKSGNFLAKSGNPPKNMQLSLVVA